MAGTALPARLPGPQKYKAPKKSAGQAPGIYIGPKQKKP